MKSILIIISGIILCFILQSYLPIWWLFVVCTFVIGYLAKLSSGWKTFFAAWIIVFITWIALYIAKDVANESIMSNKMANLFSMKSNYWLFGIVSAVMGILGGLTAVAGYYLSKKNTA